MSIFKRGRIYWYEFVLRGQRIQESTHQTNNREAMNMESVQKTRLAQGEVGIITRKQAPTFRESALGQVKKSVETQCAAKPLKEYPGEWRPLPQKLVEIAPTKPSSIAPDGMVRIPAGAFDFRVSGVEIEGANDEGVDVQYAWDSSPRRHHLHTVAIKSFDMDKYPVTNAQFQVFLVASPYRPRDHHNFLRHWKNGTFPEGWAKKPVT